MSPYSTSSRALWLTHSALYLALALVLPVGFHALGLGGRIFLPMHITVLLAGFLAGPASGLVVGLLAPGLSHLVTGMPPSYAVPLMSLELPVYGLIAGLAYIRLGLNVYIALLIAIVFGRVMFGIGMLLLGLFMELPYSVAFFFSSAGPIVTGLPGLAIQIVIVPVLVAAVRRRRSDR
ncbi:MAG TPA: ECF transporter S component [Acidobacteriota bacterium]|nr:ECF transporter S component [Acidobacteriota bacterium]